MLGDEQEPRRNAIAKYLRYYHVGLQLFVGIVLFTLGGVWLDRWLGTRVLFTLLGLALGFAGGLRAVYIDLYGRSGDGASARGRPGPRGASVARDERGSHNSDRRGESSPGGPASEGARDGGAAADSLEQERSEGKPAEGKRPDEHDS